MAKNQDNIDDFQRMYDNLKDPEQVAKNKRVADRKKDKENKIKDTGL